MSTYLLLRNNKETGPFTIEEMKGMSLKAYDLVWIVGKSAAWRYPGEIPEFKSFAPAVPEEAGNPFVKKTNPDIFPTDPVKKAEPANVKSRENNLLRTKSVYVNLPAEKKISVVSASGVLYDTGLQPSPEPAFDFSDLYKKKPTRTVRYSGKVLWFSTIILLFGTGILTGFYISDRRKFFTSDANRTQLSPAVHPAKLNPGKEITPVQQNTGSSEFKNIDLSAKDLSGKSGAAVSGRSVSGTGKKNLKNSVVKKDSVVLSDASGTSVRLTDSSQKQNDVSKNDLLFQKIKADPESYVSLVTGRYTTGIFGGVSSVPVTVTNNSPVLMDLVVVKVEYIQSNDKVFKTESISFNDLEPGETVTVKAPKSPRGTKVIARLHLINSHKMDLNYSKQ